MLSQLQIEQYTSHCLFMTSSESYFRLIVKKMSIQQQEKKVRKEHVTENIKYARERNFMV